MTIQKPCRLGRLLDLRTKLDRTIHMLLPGEKSAMKKNLNQLDVEIYDMFAERIEETKKTKQQCPEGYEVKCVICPFKKCPDYLKKPLDK